MRVLITILPGTGSLHSLIPLAQALRVAGNEVVIASSKSFSKIVVASGFECIPAGYDWLCAEPEEMIAEMRRTSPEAAKGDLFWRDVFAGLAARHMARDVIALSSRWKPAVIVSELGEFGGALAAEYVGIPHVESGAPFTLWDASLFVLVQPALDEIRRELGLPPDPDLRMPGRYLYLAFLPPAFIAPHHRVPETTHFLRPLSFNESGSETLPDWIDNLPSRPVVHASLGTVFNREPGLNELILDALRAEPLNLILTVGRNEDPRRFGPQPDHVHIETYTPSNALLPRCDAVITHGGFNTVIACLNHGLPMVIMPIGGDHPIYARRCAELNVAKTIEAARRAPDTIREATWDVLTTPRYRHHAQQLQHVMAALPGPDRAVTLLDALIHKNEPLVSDRQAWRQQHGARG